MTQAITTKTKAVEPFTASAEKGKVIPFVDPNNIGQDSKTDLWKTMSPEEQREYQIACQRKAMEESQRSKQSSSNDSSREQQQQQQKPVPYSNSDLAKLSAQMRASDIKSKQLI